VVDQGGDCADHPGGIGAGRQVAALYGPADDDGHLGGASGEEARQHLLSRPVLHSCRDHAGEGRLDGWIPEAGHHAAGECAEIGVEVSLVGHGYLLRRMLGHEVGQQPIKAGTGCWPRPALNPAVTAQ